MGFLVGVGKRALAQSEKRVVAFGERKEGDLWAAVVSSRDGVNRERVGEGFAEGCGFHSNREEAAEENQPRRDTCRSRGLWDLTQGRSRHCVKACVVSK